MKCFFSPTAERHHPWGGLVLAGLTLAGAGGCLKIKSDPVEVKPIHITMDVNVNVKVDRQLDNFFGDVDAARQADTEAAPTTPASKETKTP
jgi:hypothetical protein